MTKHRLGRAAAIACCLTGLSVVAIPGLAARSATVIPGSVPCEALASLVLDQTAIVSAKAVAAGQFAPAAGGGRTDPSLYRSLPAFCRVESVLKPTPDAQIGVEVWLPAEGWNGKFQEVGNGGWSGSIPYPALARAVARGYAAASTDTGHKGDTAAFALGSTGETGRFRVARRTPHGGARKDRDRSVLRQRSEVLILEWLFVRWPPGAEGSARFPDDFDGIVAGAPANNWVNQKVAHILVQQEVNRDATTRIPASKYPALHAAVLATCDHLDGVRDGVLEDPWKCTFDPAVLTCKGDDAPDCLTSKQVATAKRLYSPSVDPTTKAEIFPGLAPGTELSWDTAAGPEPRATQIDLLTYVVFKDPKWDYKTFDVARHLPLALKIDAEGSTTAATDPNLTPFVLNGGKLLLYHGWADPNIMAMNTVKYCAGSCARRSADASTPDVSEFPRTLRTTER